MFWRRKRASLPQQDMKKIGRALREQYPGARDPGPPELGAAVAKVITAPELTKEPPPQHYPHVVADGPQPALRQGFRSWLDRTFPDRLPNSEAKGAFQFVAGRVVASAVRRYDAAVRDRDLLLSVLILGPLIGLGFGVLARALLQSS